MIVTFNDNSLGDIDTWYWDFGDGDTGSIQSPIHEYTSLTVTLNQENMNSSDSVTVQLHKAEFGWNQIASPYTYPVRLSSSLTLWEWDSELRDFIESDGVLYPWDGYWVLTENLSTLVISSDPLFIEKKRSRLKKTYFVKEKEWTFNIALTSNINKDTDNLFGFSEYAKNGYDKLDRPEPPRMGNEPYIFFSHPEWKRSVTRFSSDIRHYWNIKKNIFQVGISSCAKDVSNLTLTISGYKKEIPIYVFVSTMSGVVQYDPGDAIVIKPSKETQYRTLFVSSNKDFLLNFPFKFTLNVPYPNPIRSRATIKYSLPYRWQKDGWLNENAYKVSMNIYDSRGRLIRELINRKKDPGNYTVTWYGKNNTGRSVSSGFYVCRLVAGKYLSVKKIIVNR